MIGIAPLIIIKTMNDHTDAHAQHAIDGPHPFRIPPGQVIIDGDQMDAPARQGIQIHRHGGRQGLSFTGLHLRNLAFVQDQPAQDLNIERPHVHRSPGCFADNGKGFGHDVIERSALGQLFPEIGRPKCQLGIRHFCNGRFQIIDFVQSQR